MTTSTRGPSLLQARHNAHSHAHSLFHRIRHNLAGEQRHEHGHHDHANVLENRHHENNARDNKVELGPDEVRGETEQNPSLRSTSSSGDSDDTLEIRAVTEKIVLNAVKDSSNSLITKVVQTISLVQYVDLWGNTLGTKTIAGPPNTVVVDAKTGKTVAISVGAPQATSALPGSSPGGSSLDLSSLSTAAASISSSGSSGSQTSTPSSITAAHASIGTNIRNSTNTVVHGNSTFIPPANASNSNNSSLYKPLVFSGPVSLPVTTGTTKSHKVLTTHSSHYSTSPTSTTTSPGDDNVGTLTVAGSNPTTSSDADSGSGGGVNLSPQQKQVIGGVVGAVAGVAVLGLLLMLLLRYKKRKERRTIMDGQSMGNVSRSLGDGTSGGSGGGGSGSAMAERSSASASAAVAAALASLTGKRTTPPQTADSGERGFYRVSGRKLPPVLYNGGDGYSDPTHNDGDSSSRESARSGTSDYYRGSQAFDPTAAGGVGQLSLGAPMRPVSGVPIMRSGPARTAVAENPFEDPPSTPPHNSSARTLGSRESPRASGSRFQERI